MNKNRIQNRMCMERGKNDYGYACVSFSLLHQRRHRRLRCRRSIKFSSSGGNGAVGRVKMCARDVCFYNIIPSHLSHLLSVAAAAAVVVFIGQCFTGQTPAFFFHHPPPNDDRLSCACCHHRHSSPLQPLPTFPINVVLSSSSPDENLSLSLLLCGRRHACSPGRDGDGPHIIIIVRGCARFTSCIIIISYGILFGGHPCTRDLTAAKRIPYLLLPTPTWRSSSRRRRQTFLSTYDTKHHPLLPPSPPLRSGGSFTWAILTHDNVSERGYLVEILFRHTEIY